METKTIKIQKYKYTCDVCGTGFDWTEKSMWFGSYKDLEELTMNNILFFCSEKCVDKHKKNYDGTKK